MTRSEYEGILAIQLDVSRLHSLLSVLFDATEDGRMADALEVCVQYTRIVQKRINDVPGFHAAATGNPTKEDAHG